MTPSASQVSVRPNPPLGLVIAAFLAVYLIWGSTYLGIHLAIDSLPPLLMAGSRFVIAGLALYFVMRHKGAPRPTGQHWLSATLIGALLLLVGNGGVSWAQQRVPTNLAALVIAATPLWIILVDWWRPGGKRPRHSVFVGLLLGFSGVAIMVLSKDATGHRVLDPIRAGVLLSASICWAFGSILSRHAKQPTSSLLAVSMQMMTGGALLLLAGWLTGEGAQLHWSRISATSGWAFVYLTLVGSLIGFSAYVWLLKVSTPARVSTYAYVNPLIAVLLGRLVLHEALPASALIAAALILAAVLVITTAKAQSD